MKRHLHSVGSDPYSSDSHGKYVAVWCLHKWTDAATQHQHVCIKDARTEHHHKCRCEAVEEI